MTVRAKFVVQRIERMMYNSEKEMQNIVMTPVYGTGDTENAKFWQYTPSGEIRLGTINAEAAAEFELGKEYYIDFTRAE